MISYGLAFSYGTVIAFIGLIFTFFLWYEDSVFKRKIDTVIVALLLAVVIYDLSLKFLDDEKDLLVDEFTKLCETDLLHDETHISLLVEQITRYYNLTSGLTEGMRLHMSAVSWFME